MSKDFVTADPRSSAVDRRSFLLSLTGGVSLLVVPVMEFSGNEPEGTLRLGDRIELDSAGRITVYTGKVEIGQGIRTALAQAVGEELGVPVQGVDVVMADTDRVPDDGNTTGSKSTPSTLPRVRRAAATAREFLLSAAADRWGRSSGGLQVYGAAVVDPDRGREISFAELIAGREMVRPVQPKVALKPLQKWESRRAPVPALNGVDIVTGRQRYVTDMQVDAMLFAKVVRPPSFQSRPQSVGKISPEFPDASLVRDDDLLAVVAEDEWTARQAAEALPVRWRETAWDGGDHSGLSDRLKATAGTPDDQRLGKSRRYQFREVQNKGDVDSIFTQAEEVLRARYEVPYIAHCPMEPRAAVARWQGERLQVWTGTQRPFPVRRTLAEHFSIPEDQVQVVVPDMGGGFGGKHRADVALEAARIARKVRRPVKLLWSREEEFTWAYFRPSGAIEVQSVCNRDGRLTAWEAHNYNSGPNSLAVPYEIPNVKAHFHTADSPLRQGSYRALSSTANHFARESHLDEAAARLGSDPLEFRLKHLTNPRLRAVLKRAAQLFSWEERKRRPGRGFGLACGVEKGSYVACCAEIVVDMPGRILEVQRVVEVFECGAVTNQDRVLNQVEGAVVQGLGGALWERIRFEAGRILNPAFSRYRVPRQLDTPEIVAEVLPRDDLKSAGSGETPIVVVAPALANAIWDAVAVRVRSLPLVQGLFTRDPSQAGE